MTRGAAAALVAIVTKKLKPPVRPPRLSRKNAVAELAKPRAPWKTRNGAPRPARASLPDARLPPTTRIRPRQTYAKLERKSLTTSARHNPAISRNVNI
jgi:hypothetical protein